MPQRASVPEAIEAIIPNLHWNYSGVTATNRAVAPRVAQRVPAAWIGRDRPDGIAALSFGALMRLRGVSRRRPIVWHARRNNEMIAGLLLNALGFRLKLLFTSAAQRHHTWITRALIARMDAVIATSAASASYLRRAATVIHHGVDTDLYRPPEDRAAAWAQTGLPGRYGIGCFGRVRPQKGTDVFVAAMCRLLPRYPDFTAVVIGRVDPEHRGFFDGLRRDVAAAGLEARVRFLEELPADEVPVWHRRVSVYAFTSRNEGFGLTLLEAMASGAALVAARAGAAETVVTDGVDGMLVPPGDVDALTAALEPLLADPAAIARLGARARAKAVAAYSIDVEADAIAAVYRTLLGRAASANGDGR